MIQTSEKRRRFRRGTGLAAAGAAGLAASALYNLKRSRAARRDAPPIGSFVEVDGVRLHYVDRGAGPPLVLLHGNGALIQDFEVSGLLDAAAENYRVIAFDRPGFGYSERPRRKIWTPAAQAELIHQALVKLGVERSIVLGHSWGTMPALALALDRPDSVEALVLVAGYYFPSLRAEIPLLAGPAIPLIGDVLRYTISPLLARAAAPATIRTIFAPAPVPARFSELPLELSLQPAQVRASAADMAMMVPAAAMLSRRYAELDLPIVIVSGDGDRVVSHDGQAERLHAMLPQSELLTLTGVGHMAHHSAMRSVIGAIDRAAQLSEETRRPQGEGVAAAEEVVPEGAASF